MNRDPQVMRYFPGLMNRATSDAFVDRLQEQHRRLGYTLWVVEVLDGERGSTPFAGFTGLRQPSFQVPFEHHEPVVEVGWRLQTQWWGLGIATEAARASMAHGFHLVGLPEIVSLTVVANARSRAVMERIGRQPDGEFDHPGPNRKTAGDGTCSTE